MAIEVRVAGKGAITSERPLSGRDVLRRVAPGDADHVMAWRVNRYLRPLGWVVDEDAEVEFVDTSSFEGIEVYRRTLSWVLALACRRALGVDVFVRHSISHSYYCELAEGEITEEKVARVRDAVQALIDQDIPIVPEVLPLDKVRRIFNRQGNHDKARLFRWAAQDPVNLYRCGKRYGFFYAPLAPSTGFVGTFDLLYYPPGMVLRFPTVAYPTGLPPFHASSHLVDVFREYGQWLDVLNVSTMASLHEQVAQGRAQDLILISEAFHSQRLARLAEEIGRHRDIKVLCLAGPSASGKTTTARRLEVQLQVCGLQPVTLSLDNYFLSREQTPRDEEGNYDFEALEALDLERINSDLSRLVAGEEVQLPRFDFVTGSRKPGRTVRLGERNVLIVEGIHGLNDRVTASVPPDRKYRLFVAPLTGVSLDRHNRTSTTDNRLLRRLVRDHNTRGYSPERTLLQWPSVVRGSHRHIFPHQEHADAMFNTALIYELSVLKGYAEPLLRTVSEESPVFGDAQRLLAMFRYVPVVPADKVPIVSIIREFIGGGCFEV
ncbi:MAG: nucleoside kinase [Synergistales bacterium]|nr:nucleoside kinase [Synergistales bacterium]